MKSYNNFIFDALETKAYATPNEVAIIENNGTISYHVFYERINYTAKWLNLNGIKRGDVVAFMMNRSIDMIVVIFSILRAGAAFMPISSTCPANRIDYLMRDSMAKMLITDRNYSGKMQGKVVCVKDIDLSCELDFDFPTVQKNDIAYVMYTSGSTGEPKGVLIEYQSLYNRLIWQHTKFPIGAQDVILQKTICTFDVSVWEILWWALGGSKLCLLPPNCENSPKAILLCIKKWNVTVVHFVPTVFGLFLDYLDGHSYSDQLDTLKYCFLSGEQAKKEDISRFYRLNKNTRLINLYGPTEATIDVTCFECVDYEKYDKIPIGKAIDNTQIFIIDENGLISEQGDVGELCIGGVQLAHAYLNRAELTKNKFIHIDNKVRIYRTGDLARILPDGNYEYCGRLDRQIKINGMRIELMEIESQMLRLDYILRAAVTLVKHNYLVAYYMSTDEIDAKRIRNDLKRFLPSYMVPIRFIYCPDIRLKENGKIDYNSLPVPTL